MSLQVSSAAVRKEDVVGISSLSFSNTGNGIYLSSSRYTTHVLPKLLQVHCTDLIHPTL